MQRCQDCSRWKWPAAWRCGDCGSWNLPWQDLTLEGVVFSWTTTWHPFAGTEGIGSPPFTSVLAALPHAGDRRILGLFEGDDASLDLGVRLKGRIDETKFANTKIPSIRWRVA